MGAFLGMVTMAGITWVIRSMIKDGGVEEYNKKVAMKEGIEDRGKELRWNKKRGAYKVYDSRDTRKRVKIRRK